MSDLHHALQQHFGFSSFRPGQEQVISSLLAGRSALAVFPTGGGKSLTYQLPALLMDGLTLVVSPLIALMKDQVDALAARGIVAARLDSSLSAAEAADIYDRMTSGALRLLYCAPERLTNEGFRARLARTKIALLAIDEAHCISEWGHNFRPEYLKLAGLARTLEVPRVLALTATATPAVAADICRAFSITGDDHVHTGFFRPNLHLRITPCTAAERTGLLIDALRKRPDAPTIVYVTLQETAEGIATQMQRAGLQARAYHAGLPDEVRAETQEAFMGGAVPIIVATIAFGMGIDKSDIRAVYHFNLPKSMENWMQEIGRAGRDGKPALCRMLACGDDATVLENFTWGDTPTPQSLRSLLDSILRLGSEFEISQYELSANHDIRPLVIATALTYLELEGWIAATTPRYAEYKVRLLRDEPRILAGYDARRQQFLRDLFASGTRGHTWITINPETAAQRLGAERERIIRALNYLADQGDAILKPSGVRHGYRLLRQPEDLALLTDVLAEMFARREANDLKRLETVKALAATERCLWQTALDYFGEALPEPCGQCDRCREPGKTWTLPVSPARGISTDEAEAIQALVAERIPALRTPRQMARFLCGLSSPAATRARLSRRDEFGLLTEVPFSDVLAHCDALAM